MWPGRRGRDLFAIGGGGARGAVHLGYLRPLWDRGVRADGVWGCSVGGLVGYCWAAHDLPLAERIFADIKRPSNVVRDRGPAAAFAMDGRYTLVPMMSRYVRPNARVESLRCPLNLSVVGLRAAGGNLRHFEPTTDQGLHLWLEATASIPVLMRPVHHGGEVWVDGGVAEVVPLRPALEAARPGDRVWALVCRPPDAVAPWHARRRPKGRAILERYVDLVLAEVIGGDLDEAEVERHVERGVEVTVLRPRTMHGGTLDFWPDNISAWIEEGLQVSENALQ